MTKVKNSATPRIQPSLKKAEIRAELARAISNIKSIIISIFIDIQGLNLSTENNEQYITDFQNDSERNSAINKIKTYLEKLQGNNDQLNYTNFIDIQGLNLSTENNEQYITDFQNDSERNSAINKIKTYLEKLQGDNDQLNYTKQCLAIINDIEQILRVPARANLNEISDLHEGVDKLWAEFKNENNNSGK